MNDTEIRNPHATDSDGRPRHYFRKVADRQGEWVCAICRPELFRMPVPQEAVSA